MGRARFIRQILQSNFRRLSGPYKLLLGLTYKCNSRCLTCRIWQREPESELTLDELQAFFTRNNHFSWVNLTGGEILLRKDLPDILTLIHEECTHLCLLNFATNGTFPRIAERVVAGMPGAREVRTAITVSVDGPPETNDRVRGTAGDFRKSVEAFTRLRDLALPGLSVFFGISLSDHNAGMLDETFLSLKREIPSLSYNDIHVNVAHTSPHYYFNGEGECLDQSDMTKRDIRDIYAKQPRVPLDAMRWLEKRYLRHLCTYLETRTTPIPCQALSASCFIDPQGTVYPCIIYNKPLGNLRDVDFDLQRIWDRRNAREIRHEIQRGNCPNCWLACEAYPSILGGMVRWKSRW